MQDSEKLKSTQKKFHADLILRITTHIKRIQELLIAESPDNRTEGVIYFKEVIFFEKVNDEIKKDIVGVNTDGLHVDVIDTRGDGHLDDELEFFNNDILIEIIYRLEDIQSFEQINLSI